MLTNLESRSNLFISDGEKCFSFNLWPNVENSSTLLTDDQNECVSGCYHDGYMHAFLYFLKPTVTVSRLGNPLLVLLY